MAAETPQQKNEVLIEGRLYNIENFRHPGGSVVKFFAGTGDATEAFVEFHMHSHKARKMMATLPSRPAPKPVGDPKEVARLKKLSEDFSAWRKKLEREGWFKPDLWHCAYRIAELIVMHVLGIYLCLYTSFWFVGLIILGLVEGRCGWLMHEAGHRSMTGNIAVDNVLQNIIMGVGDGMSAGWWRAQHNKHHATPQKLQHDIDLDTLPLVAFNKFIAHQAKGFTKFWIGMQAFMFAPLTCQLVVLSWQVILHPRYIIRTKHWDEVITIATRWLLVYYIYTLSGLAPIPYIAAYLFMQIIGGSSIFVNFALSHSHLPVVKSNEHRHWVEYSAQHTIDIHPHIITDWWMGYLNYQIEHHLFPEMPQYRFKKLWPQAKKFFEDHGLPYDSRGYWEAMGDTFKNLATVAQSV